MVQKAKRRVLVQGVDYFCGLCVGRTWVHCVYCFGGCPECEQRGHVLCPACDGGAAPVAPPDWL